MKIISKEIITHLIQRDTVKTQKILRFTFDNGETADWIINDKKWLSDYSKKRFLKAHYDSKILCGWEIESTKAVSADNDYTESKSDGSVNGDGMEYVLSKAASPIQAIRLLRHFLAEQNIQTDKSCGLHFHFSVDLPQRKKREYVRNLHIIATILEELLFDFVPESRKLNNYCLSIADTAWRNRKGSTVKQKLGKVDHAKYSNSSRYCWLNFVEFYREDGLGTIEFRLLGNTVRYNYILSMFYVYLRMIELALKYETMNLQLYESIGYLKKDTFSLLSKVFPVSGAFAPEERMRIEDCVEILQRSISNLLER